MIVEFTVENYLSIKEPQTLSFVSTKSEELKKNCITLPQEKFNLLRSSIIYGPNASGKSNLIRALYSALKMIELSSTKLRTEPISEYKPYKLDSKYRSMSTSFEIEFIADKVRYIFKTTFNRTSIIHESLYKIKKSKKSKIYIREQNKEISFGNISGPKKTLGANLPDNVLLLSHAGNTTDSLIKHVYDYFVSRTMLLTADGERSFPYVTMGVLCAQDFPQRDVIFNKIKDFIKFADISIDNISITSKKDSEPFKLYHKSPDFCEADKDDFTNLMDNYEIHFIHKTHEGESVSLKLSEESQGTQKIFSIGVLLAVALSGYQLIFLADELERSLHPEITSAIVNLFNDPTINTGDSQLILGTHETTLLSPEILRRDQIWFIENSRESGSKLFSLAEFNKNDVRKTSNYAKMYLDGRFGALPKINTSALMENK